MIPAMGAQMMNRRGSATPPWLPAGATAFLDFVNGNYWAGGASRNVGDLLGGGFDAGEISASGLFFSYSNANRPKAIGPLFTDLAAALAAGCTVVVEADHINTPFGPYISWCDASTFGASTDYVQFKMAGTSGTNSVTAVIEDSHDIGVPGAPGTGMATGIRRAAATIAQHVGGEYFYGAATGGDFAHHASVAYAPFSPVDTILIGHDGDEAEVLDEAFIRSITILPPVTPADLSALTGDGTHDANWSGVKLLLGFEGADGSTTIGDESGAAHGNATVFGNAQIDTADKRFGTSALLLDGTGDYIQWNDSADWQITPGTSGQNSLATVEFWAKFASLASGNRGICCQGNASGTRAWAIELKSGDTSELTWIFSSDGTTEQTISTTGAGLTTGVWYHIAVSKEGTQTRIYIDGVMRAVASTTGAVFNSSEPLRIGASWGGGNMAGSIDEFRITKTRARYLTFDGFVVPAVAFPRSS